MSLRHWVEPAVVFGTIGLLVAGLITAAVVTRKAGDEQAVREGRAYEADRDGLYRMGPDAYGVVCYTLGDIGYSNKSISCVQVQEALVPKK